MNQNVKIKRMWKLTIGISFIALFANVFAVKIGDTGNGYLIPINLGCIAFAFANLLRNQHTVLRSEEEIQQDTY